MLDIFMLIDEFLLVLALWREVTSLVRHVVVSFLLTFSRLQSYRSWLEAIYDPGL